MLKKEPYTASPYNDDSYPGTYNGENYSSDAYPANRVPIYNTIYYEDGILAKREKNYEHRIRHYGRPNNRYFRPYGRKTRHVLTLAMHNNSSSYKGDSYDDQDYKQNDYSEYFPVYNRDSYKRYHKGSKKYCRTPNNAYGRESFKNRYDTHEEPKYVNDNSYNAYESYESDYDNNMKQNTYKGKKFRCLKYNLSYKLIYPLIDLYR